MNMSIVTDNFNKDDIMKMDEVIRRVGWIKHTLAKLYDSDFMKKLRDAKMVVGEIKRTNTIKNHPDYNICYHLWNYIMNYQGMVLDFRVEEIPIELTPKYRKKMNKALMYFYSAVDACQKDNEKYAEAIKKSWNLNIKQTKVKLIKDTIENSDQEVVKDVIDPDLFTEQHQKQLDKLNAEKEKLRLQLKEMKEKHKRKERENRELEDNKRQFILLKEREIDELMKQKQNARESARRKIREQKEKEITALEAKRVATIRNKKYVLVSKLTSWIERKSLKKVLKKQMELKYY